jgi:hypothetical protein
VARCGLPLACCLLSVTWAYVPRSTASHTDPRTTMRYERGGHGAGRPAAAPVAVRGQPMMLSPGRTVQSRLDRQS